MHGYLYVFHVSLYHVQSIGIYQLTDQCYPLIGQVRTYVEMQCVYIMYIHKLRIKYLPFDLLLLELSNLLCYHEDF